MGFVVPPYPHDRLVEAKALASAHQGGPIDLSIGTPCDPPMPEVIAALATSDAERGYPTSLGSPRFRDAAAGWMRRTTGVDLDPSSNIASCIGTKEFVGTTPQYLKLRSPDRDTVLYPAVAYPTYEMGALLAGCRAVPVPVDEHFSIRLGAIAPDDAARALCLWVNTPGNPAGGLDDLAAAAAWGRARNVPVLSDECYISYTWNGPGRTILEQGNQGVLAVHSLSKRSNLAGIRAGFYAGDPELVTFLSEVRKHAGFMISGPVQAAATVAYDDDAHVEEQRARYYERLVRMADMLDSIGLPVTLPGGGFYLWVPVPGGDDWACTNWLAKHGGVLTSPGDFYGEAARGYVRVAVVQPDDRIELAAKRFADAGVRWEA
jgi:succinyldiaminopimelate transaminase